MVRRDELTDQQWELLVPLIPRAATGRPRVSDRQVVNGMVHKIRTGISWRDLPKRYWPWRTVHTRFRSYAVDGVVARALRQIQARADPAGASSSAASTGSRASAGSPPDTKRPPPHTRQRSVSRRSCSGQDPFEEGPQSPGTGQMMSASSRSHASRAQVPKVFAGLCPGSVTCPDRVRTGRWSRWPDRPIPAGTTPR
ncbi:transposase [Streptomyces sp. WAC04114]|nr:transposase [Streptomyces sp. WAC04114]